MNSSNKMMINSLIVLILVYVGRVQELIPGLSGIPTAKIATILVLVLYLFNKDPDEKKIPLWFCFPGKYLVFILCSAVLSIPGSVWQGKSFDFVFEFLTKIFLFMYLVFKITKTDDNLRKVSWGLPLCSLILCFAATVSPKMVEYGRASASATYDANDLALLLVMILPICYYMMENESRLTKYFLFGIITMSFVVIARTGSRGGVLALATVVIAILMKLGWSKALKVIPVLAMVAYLSLFVLGAEHLDRFKSIGSLEHDYNASESVGRLDIWKRTSKLILKHPIFGSGAGAFIAAEGQTHEGGKWSAAHNTFIQIGVELGLIALLMHIAVIWTMIKEGRRNPSWLSKGIEVGLCGYCVGGFFLSWAYAYVFYLFIALSMAQAKINLSREPKGAII